MNSPQPIASLSLDLDNQWSYLKVHGDPRWQEFPSFLDLVVPRVLDFLAVRGLQITFFIVGQDAALEKSHAALKMIAPAGHEVGNHSYSHEPWFHLYDRNRVKSEISVAEELIANVTGRRPVGYRAPGYSLSQDTLDVLEERGYVYDASTLPTFIGPLARFYYFCHSNLLDRDRKDRTLLFGSLKEGFLPLSPYRWRNGKGVLEIPVTTMPFIRLPIHLSYLLYLSKFSRPLALAYFRAALKLCTLLGVSPSLLLHPLDFLGVDDGAGLDFFPGMQLPRSRKIAFVADALAIVSEQFHVVTVLEHAYGVSGQSPQAVSNARQVSRPRLVNDL